MLMRRHPENTRLGFHPGRTSLSLRRGIEAAIVIQDYPARRQAEEAIRLWLQWSARLNDHPNACSCLSEIMFGVGSVWYANPKADTAPTMDYGD